jgi:hypothetical protein
MKYLIVLSTLLLGYFANAQGKYDGGDGDGFATIIVSNIVLPLQVIDFTAAENNGSVKARLRIQSDESICGLQLERSSDGNRFVMVDEKQSGLQGTLFVFSDAAVPTGNIYYRVKIIRCDESFIFSKTILLQADHRDRWEMQGNILNYQAHADGTLQCFSQSGQLVYARQLNRGSGQLSMPVLAAGIYSIRFNNETKLRCFIGLQ